MIRRYFILILSLLMLGVGGGLMLWQNHDSVDHASEIRRSEKALAKLEISCEGIMERIERQLESEGVSRLEVITDDAPDDFTVNVFKGDSLVWWNDNQVEWVPSDSAVSIRFVQNGWYRIFYRNVGPQKIYGLLRLCSQYPYTNRFLVNAFHPSLNVCDRWSIASPTDTAVVKLVSQKSGVALYLKSNSDAVISHPASAVLLVSGFLLILLAFGLTLKRRGLPSRIYVLFPIMLALLMRIIGSITGFPAVIYTSTFFSPEYYASSRLLNSLADLLFVSLTLTIAVGWIYSLRKRKSDDDSNPLKAFLAALFSASYLSFVLHLVSGLILNSKISFDINNVFGLDAYSFVGIIIIGLLFWSAFMLMTAMQNRYLSNYYTASAGGWLAFGSLAYLMKNTGIIQWNDPVIWMGFILWTMFVFYYSRTSEKRIKFTRYILIITAISLFSATVIAVFSGYRENESRKILANKLESNQDRIAEYLFSDVAAQVGNDRIITNIFNLPYQRMVAFGSAGDSIQERLLRNYFTGYWDKYDITIRSFNREGLPVNTGGDPSWSLDYYDQVLRNSGNDTSSYGLFFIGNNDGRIEYTGKIAVHRVDSSDGRMSAETSGIIIVNLISKSLNENAGFPELLISDKLPQQKDISNYSYAYYRESMLVNQTGNFHYATSATTYHLTNDSFVRFFNYEGYSHLIHPVNGKSFLIVSRPLPSLLDRTTLFSYLLTIYGSVFLLIYLIWLLWQSHGFLRMNISERIRASVVAMVVLTMLLSGGAAVWYIRNTYETDEGPGGDQRLQEILTRLQKEIRLRYEGSSFAIADETGYSLSSLSRTIGSDFNVYSKSGQLLFSSQPKIYEKQLTAQRMNRLAMQQLSFGNKSFYAQQERIGSLNYLSIYEPLRNDQLETYAYLNIPYFSSQAELERRISVYLVAIINIYILLFAFTVFFTFVLSSRVTKPLQMIREKLSGISFSKRYDLIEWDHKDEIGALVKEYNRMALELSASAEKLARSERESAWREMARQVAHEIKNPLTPMKLGIQHLERARREKHADLDNIIQKMSAVLIEQIDALAKIATEFSGFAQMPAANNEVVDVAKVLKSVVDLYNGTEESKVELKCVGEGPFMVYVDREQLMRVFSNIVKNAVQSLVAGRQGEVLATVELLDKKVKVAIKDNGSGINEDQRSRIFVPNFTTKSGGTGLGLAISHQIITQAGGIIWFESEEGKGTTFFVELPVFN